MLYRVKTKEELENEFGEKWRYVTAIVEGMDYLLGSEIYLPKEPIGNWIDIDGFGIHIKAVKELTNNNKNKTEENNKMKENLLQRVLESFGLNRSHNEKHEINPKDTIQSVTINKAKKVVTVVLKGGRVGISTCTAGDSFDEKIGFCIAYMNALFGSKTQVQKALNEFNGVAKKEREEKTKKAKAEAAKKLAEYQKKVNGKNKKKLLAE